MRDWHQVRQFDPRCLEYIYIGTLETSLTSLYNELYKHMRDLIYDH